MPAPNTTTTNTPPQGIQFLVDAFRGGHQTVLVSGRSLYDLHVNPEDKIRPLMDTLYRQVHAQFGMVTLKFNLALGARWQWQVLTGEERQAFEQALAAASIPLTDGIRAVEDHTRSPYERAFLLLASIHRSLELGKDVPPILIHCEFGENLAPAADSGGASEWMVQIGELLQLLSADHMRRRHQFALLVFGTPERMDQRVVSSLRAISLPQPDVAEKLTFLTALRQIPGRAPVTMETGLDDRSIANLTARTPNQGLEEAFQEASRTGKPIQAHQLLERKRADVTALSEGTLSLLDTDRVRNVRLVGRTVQRPLELLGRWADGLQQGDPHTPPNVILAGAPSTAKTDLLLIAATRSLTPAYAVLSPKGSLVGQTEQRVRLLFRTFKELSPAIGFIDEITEAFPTERSSMNLDSGASASVTAEMLNALSDSSRAGKTLLLATTNCPWKVGAAMASRFLFVPVLSAVEEDYPEILCAIAQSLLPEVDWDASAGVCREAAATFYRKGASPRIMRSLVMSKIADMTRGGRIGPTLLQRAANACAWQDPRDRASAEYADLYAIRVCSDMEMLPWHGQSKTYPFPPYLRGIIDPESGSANMDSLNARLEELHPLVNV